MTEIVLTGEERAMQAGEMGWPLSWAINHQLQVARMFDACDLVPVSQAHMMADPEAVGEAGADFMEELVRQDARVAVPTITDPRGVDLDCYRPLGQSEEMAGLERRIIAACTRMGILMTNTCVNYQTIMPPVAGDHVAYGDTGVVIYSNSVCGARSNFEGGPSALAAGLTGRTPRYGLHLDENRRATRRFVVTEQPCELTDWGALGAVVGELSGSYWEVPVIEGLEVIPNSDQMKHLGAAMASFGSTPLFHLVGITPEARRLSDVDGDRLEPETVSGEMLGALRSRFGATGEKVDVVVFAAPQLSIVEMQQVAELCRGRTMAVPLVVCTSPQVYPDAVRHGFVSAIEASGGMVLQGTCFYNQFAREIGEANGWKRLLSNSAKIVNILGGYGYEPALASMEQCVASAVAGGDPPMITLRCHAGIGPKAEGVALVARDNFSARYDLDRRRGIFSRPGHVLAGRRYHDMILVMNTVKGGVATAWMLLGMKRGGPCPRGFLFNAANTIMAQGAALADIALCDRFADGDITELVRDGDHLVVDPALGLVQVTNRR